MQGSSHDRNPWTVLSSETRYESGWLSLVDHDVRDAAGRRSRYGVVHFKHLGLRVLPVDREGFTYLVGQYRFGAGYYSWELPSGGGEPGEEPLAAAKRELREEVGLDAAQWLPLLDLVPSGSVTDERNLIFVAWGFDKVEREPDPQEVLQVRRVPFAQALAMALSGEIRDMGTVATFLAAQARALGRSLPAELAERLVRSGV